MARHNKKGRTRGDGRFVRLDFRLMDTPAWHSLSPPAVKVLLHLWRRHNGFNNGEIPYGVRDAVEIGIKRDTTARALKELQEKGFLRCTSPSSFDQKRRARTWALTAERVESELATRDFQSWRNLEHSPTRRTDSLTHRTVMPESRTLGNATDRQVGLYGPKSPSRSPMYRTLSSLPGGALYNAPPDKIGSSCVGEGSQTPPAAESDTNGSTVLIALPKRAVDEGDRTDCSNGPLKRCGFRLISSQNTKLPPHRRWEGKEQ